MLEEIRMAQDQRTGEDGRDVQGAARPAGRRNEARRTTIHLELEHWKDLPEDAAEMIAQRAYNLLYSRGVEAGVRVAMQVTEQS